MELSRNRFTNRRPSCHTLMPCCPRVVVCVSPGLSCRRLDVFGGGEDVQGLAADGGQVGQSVPGRGAGRDGSSVFAAAPQPDPDARAAQAADIVHLRWRKRRGPVPIAGQLGVPASTVHAVLTRCRINRLSHIDRVTGKPIRRYEHAHPGSLIHVDVTKFGNILDGGGHRFVGRQQGERNRSATVKRTGSQRNKHRNPVLGRAFVHTVVDDHSRVAYAEICADETAATAIEVLQRAVSWFGERGVIIERVLSDNGSAYKSHAWRNACAGQNRNDEQPCPAGSTSTITTEPTAQSEANRRSAA